MVQSFNSKAILTLASILKRPYLIVPHVHVSNISEINFNALKNYVDAVVFDKDNTLTAPYENVLHKDATIGLKNAIDIFGIDRVAIVSNSAGTLDDPEYKDAIAIEESLGIKVIRHDEKKPGGLNELLQHFDSQVEQERICIVGDRLLTDIVFGNLYGMLSIHTLPLCKTKEENSKDNKIANTLRTMENGILYKNWFGSRKLQKSKLQHKYWNGENRDENELKIVITEEEKEEEEEEKDNNNETPPPAAEATTATNTD